MLTIHIVSPTLAPLIANYMHCPYARVYHNIEDVLRVIALLISLTFVHTLYAEGLTFDKDFTCFRSLSD